MAKSPFQYLSSVEAETPTGFHAWAKRLIDLLRGSQLLTDFIDKPLMDEQFKVVRVKEDGTGYELADEELGLADADLTGHAKHVVRVKADESGYEITPEELGLYGVSLVGKGGYFVKVKADASGFEIVP